MRLENHALNASRDDTSDDETKNITDTEKIQRLNVEIDVLESILKKTQEQENQNQKLNEELKRELKGKVQELTNIEQIFKENTQLFNNLLDKHNRLDESYIELTKTNVHDELLKKHKVYQKHVNSLETTLSTQKNKIQELEESKNAYDDDFQLIKKQNETLKNEIKKITTENINLTQEISELENYRDEVNKKNETLTRIVNSIKIKQDKCISIYKSLLLFMYNNDNGTFIDLITNNLYASSTLHELLDPDKSAPGLLSFIESINNDV